MLGTPELWIEGTQISIGGPKAQSVLGTLAVRAGQLVTADWLIDQLWGASPPQSARVSLQAYISRVRALHPPVTEAILPRRAGGYLLAHDVATIDTHEYDRHSTEGRALAASGRWAAALDRLDMAAALWRGSPFSGIDAVPELALERDRLLDLAASNNLAALRARLELFDPAEVVPPLRDLIIRQPWDERGWLLLMLALYRSGRQTEALEAATTARRMLADAKGLDTGPGLAELERMILQQDPRLLPTGAQLAIPRWLAQTSAQMIGRDEQLDVLTGYWEQSSSGIDPRVVMVKGEPGVGKSLLAAKFAEKISNSGVAVVAGRCFDTPRLPMQPWTDLLEGKLVAPGSLPYVADGESGLDIWEFAAYEMFTTVMRHFEALLEAGPVLVVLDDIQWAGVAAIRVLDYLVANCRGRDLMVIATIRSAGADMPLSTERALGELAVRTHAREIRLNGLGIESFTELLVARGHRFTEERVAALRESTGGVPLLAISVLDGGDDLLALPLGRASEDAVRVAELLATAGGTCSVTALRYASNMSEPDIDRALEELIAVGLVRQIDDLYATCEFAHGLYRDSLVARITDARKLMWARRLLAAADELRGHFTPPSTAALALTSAKSGIAEDVDRAIAECRAAAGWSAQFHEHAEAMRWCAQAVELAERADAPLLLRSNVKLEHGIACRRAGFPFREIFLSAAEAATKAEDPEMLANVCVGWSRGSFSQIWETDAEYLAYTERVLAQQSRVSAPLRARVLGARAAELTWADEGGDRFDIADEALALARAAEDPSTIAHVLLGRNMAIAAADTLDIRRAEATELLDIARSLGDPGLEFQAMLQACGPAIDDGNIGLVGEMLSRAEAIANALRQPVLQWTVAYARASLSLWQGRLSLAEEYSQEALEQGMAAGFAADAMLFAGGQFAEIRRLQGRLGEITRPLERMPIQPHGLFGIARYQYEAGLFEQAAARLDHVRMVDGTLQLRRDCMERINLDYLAFLAVHLDRPDVAAAVEQRLLPLADTFGHDAVSGLVGHHWLGVLAAFQARPEAAVQHFERAVRIQNELGMPLLAAESQRELGWAYKTLGQHGRQHAAHAEVRHVACLFGAEGLLTGLSDGGHWSARYS
ncbi:BTAD domain-containing putative transcriptional regulator [Mycobacteroides franklinii]|nr:BTAD domain-containing putative transcriptional regulator [Mycobacteroides franklinii]